MADVLDLYAEPYDARYPVVCFDECPYQLVGEVRTPLPPVPEQPQRYDYHYQRHGTWNLFIFFAPQEGWRHVTVTERRTKQDFAHQMQELVEHYCPEAERIRLVVDNLNTPTPAALYETCPAGEAPRLRHRLEFHYTPKHGSWLNMVESERAVLAGQCLQRRLPTRGSVQQEATAWERQRNAAKATVRWRLTTGDARTKLKRLYPL